MFDIVEVVKIDKETCKCVAIKKMNIKDWRVLKKQSKFNYYAFELGFHSYKVEV